MTLVMGIVNVTPDSFSDGGRWVTVDAAIARGRELVADGADIVDVGGESTRPGAAPVDRDTELARVVPVVRALSDDGVRVSIDTMWARTAAAAVEAGAQIVNDVSGGLADPDMAATVADLACEYIAMHWRAHAAEMDAADRYDDVVTQVRDELAARVDALLAAGVALDRIILDPGLGFAKVGENNWPLLARMDVWSAGFPVLIGASRKRFLGAVVSAAGGTGEDAAAREHATTAVTTLAAQAGAWGVRVHEAAPARDALAVVSAWQDALGKER